MTIVRRITHFPAIDKVSECRELLERRVSDVTSRGFTPRLISRIYADDGPELAVFIRFDDMDAEAQFRAEPQDLSFRVHATAISRRGWAVALFTPLVQGGPGRWDNTRYFAETTVRASAGNTSELRVPLEEFTRARQADGKRVALHAQVLSPTGPTFLATETFATLSEYESANITNSPPGLTELAAKIKGVMLSPAERRMYEIL